MKALFSFLALASLTLADAAHAEITVGTVTTEDPMPTKVLTCGASIITEIGGRLEGDTDFSTGVSVGYKNNGYQTSYDKVQAVINSRLGDHVMICLVYIPDPRRCPPGDTRGRRYTVTNLRMLTSWTLSDSEHECGGA